MTAPWETAACAALLLAAPVVADGGGEAAAPPGRRAAAGTLAAMLVLLGAALTAVTATVAYAAIALLSLQHAREAWPRTRTGAVWLAVGAGLALVTAVAVHQGLGTVAFAVSTLLLLLRAGVVPFHAGVTALCDRAPAIQAQQLGSLVALVFAHLRFVDHQPVAAAVAPALVLWGALAALAAALVATVQRDLRGFYRGTATMHGGMLLAAIGTAPAGNFAAALHVVVTMGLALAGIGMAVAALEARVGQVVLHHRGGRVADLPRLALVFALFGGAGVGLPGMAGFVADDLLLHALWLQSPGATTLVIFAAAFLAVATLRTFSAVFLGPPLATGTPDLRPGEAVSATLLLGLLVLLGLAPGLLLSPAARFLQ